MTRRADKHFANQYVKYQGKVPGATVLLQLPEFPMRGTSPTEDYHLALAPSDSSTDEELTTDDDRSSTTCSE